MKRTAKRKLSTVAFCVLGGVTFTGPMAGVWMSDYQCRRGLCTHPWHRHRYVRSALREPEGERDGD